MKQRGTVFSVGFGPVILKKKIGETEYRLSAIPLGGFIKMAGEEEKAGPKPAHAEIRDSHLIGAFGTGNRFRFTRIPRPLTVNRAPCIVDREPYTVSLGRPPTRVKEKPGARRRSSRSCVSAASWQRSQQQDFTRPAPAQQARLPCHQRKARALRASVRCIRAQAHSPVLDSRFAVRVLNLLSPAEPAPEPYRTLLRLKK